MHAQAIHVAVFERFDGFSKNHAVCRAIAVKQGKRAVGLRFQHGLQDRKDGRNATACCKRRVIFGLSRKDGRVKIAHWRHHVQRIAGVQLLVGKGGKQTLRNFFNGHPQFAVVGACADRIRTPHVFAVQGRSQGEVLPREELVISL